MSTFGERLREVRLSKGVRQRDLAARVSVSRGTISNLEAGRSGCSVTSLMRLAEALDVPAAELLPVDHAQGSAPLPGSGRWGAAFYHGELLSLRRELDDMRARALGLRAQLDAEVARHTETKNRLKEAEAKK